MAKVLGLDLGSASIGWAVVTENNEEVQIEALGSRIIPLSPDDVTEFTQGNAISKNATRTLRRTQRKGYDRYQQRRANLTEFLNANGMLQGEALIKLEKLQLWGVRARAVSERLALPEIGRVLYHLNQKRGYKSAREDNNDKNQREYVEKVMNRHKEIAARGITIGQLFFEELSKDSTYRTKERVFPRKAYEEEFDRIVACQREFYPQLFTDEKTGILKHQILFYQRRLKSCKHLVSVCEFEGREYVNKSGKIVFDGPKVAPKSSPLAQLCKNWESVNNLTLSNRRGERLDIKPSQRRELVEYLDQKEKLTLTDLYRILEIRKSDGWWGRKAIGKGLQGNTTKNLIRKALGGEQEELLRFNLTKKDTDLVDVETGEVIPIISEVCLEEPLYRLWHLIYSIKEKAELAAALKKQFGITDPTLVDNLFALDFVKQGYTNKSAKAMRRILPFLELGVKYSEACERAGFRHSESLTKEENESRELQSRLKSIVKNELRQPIVEKILNQMINVVNALLEKHGPFDEIHVELARELKQSREERSETTKAFGKAERENKSIAERIASEYNLTPTRSRIQKYKMWEEAEYACIYCGKRVEVSEFLRGFDVEVEHIIPRSLFFDDSMSNKACACRNCNKAKGNQTAYDFMNGKSQGEFEDYLQRVERLFKDKKKTKYKRLLTKGDEIPTDFIDRQLRESQYIARKSREILSSVCRNVTATSGSVTDFIRHTWGWDRVLHNLNLERYKLAGLTEIKEREHKSNNWNEEVIKEWTKRLDHRHHAIDALVIACTKQGYIQRINNMSELKDVIFAPDERQGKEYQERLTKLEKYILLQPHFSTGEVEQAADSILVSFKAGKKAASLGKRYMHRGHKRILVQEKVVIPRGALHEESVYGVIDRYAQNRKGETIFEKQSVLKYPLASIARKDIDFIVDARIRELVRQRFENFSEREKDVWKDMENAPLLFNEIPIRSVRCFTGLKPEATATLDRGSVKLGNNHHIAIYIDGEGKRHESCVTFWHAVERKQQGIPILITKPNEIWDALPAGLSDAFLKQLPDPNWTFEVSLQQNEMFILGLEPEAFEEAYRTADYRLLSKYLYRVQNISTRTYRFCLHNLTQYDISKSNKPDRRFLNITSVDALFRQNPQKVYVSLLSKITKG